LALGLQNKRATCSLKHAVIHHNSPANMMVEHNYNQCINEEKSTFTPTSVNECVYFKGRAMVSLSEVACSNHHSKMLVPKIYKNKNLSRESCQFPIF
jgi:hypothetical protein